MKCPVCGGKTRVIESGFASDEVIRRRKCVECGQVFFTTETDAIDQEGAKKLLYKYRNASR